jgi:hypothetical protein
MKIEVQTETTSPAMQSAQAALDAILTLRGALADLLAFYDRVTVGRDHGGWTASDVQRLAEIRELVASG